MMIRAAELETVHLYGETSSWEEATPTVLALLFGEMLKRGLPVIKYYHSDLYHDAVWLHTYVTGPTTFEWIVRSHGTHIAEVVSKGLKAGVQDGGANDAVLFAVRLFIRPGTAGTYRATFARLPLAAESKRTSEGAHDSGLHQGWSAANYAEAYGKEEVPEAEAFRRSCEQLSYARAEWEAGFLEGWQLFEDECWQDGTPQEV